jgi:hypothetical protein
VLATLCIRLVRAAFDVSCGEVIVVMETTQDAQRYDGPVAPAWIRRPLRSSWNPLLDALMRPKVVEVVNILSEDPAKLPFVEDQHAVQTFLADTPEEAFTDRIGPWSKIRGSQYFNSAGGRQTRAIWGPSLLSLSRIR